MFLKRFLKVKTCTHLHKLKFTVKTLQTTWQTKRVSDLRRSFRDRIFDFRVSCSNIIDFGVWSCEASEQGENKETRFCSEHRFVFFLFHEFYSLVREFFESGKASGGLNIFEESLKCWTIEPAWDFPLQFRLVLIVSTIKLFSCFKICSVLYFLARNWNS